MLHTSFSLGRCSSTRPSTRTERSTELKFSSQLENWLAVQLAVQQAVQLAVQLALQLAVQLGLLSGKSELDSHILIKHTLLQVLDLFPCVSGLLAELPREAVRDEHHAGPALGGGQGPAKLHGPVLEPLLRGAVAGVRRAHARDGLLQARRRDERLVPMLR